MTREKEDDNFYREHILNAIQWHWNTYGYGPTLRDIAKKVGMVRMGKPASTSVINYHLGILVEQGKVLREQGIARSIRLSNMRFYHLKEE
jgi:hypothetical protein